jgi:hypothetical protein
VEIMALTRHRLDNACLIQDAFDPYIKAFTTIEENHRLIHDGLFYTTYVYAQDVANGGNLDMLISVPADSRPHFQSIDLAFESGPNTLLFYEGVTTSADGVALTALNKNRNATRVPEVTCYSGPTVTDLGTELGLDYFPVGGKKEGALTVGGNGEWILKPSTKYLLRFTNNTGQVEDLEIRVFWYEVDYQ